MFIKSEKRPSPPFTRNYLTHKTLNKKVKGEGLKTLFYIYARQGKKSVFSFFWLSGFSKNPKKKEYNIRFKIYPSPFTSSPQHISIIVFPTFVFLFTELSHVVQERARSFCPLPLLYPSASDFQFHSAGDRWFRACGAYM